MQFAPNPPKSGAALRAEWGRHLIAWIKSSVIPRGDGSTTIVHGCTVSAKYNSTSTSGDTYNGYFKVIKTADNKIKIVNGNDVDNAKCGYATINDIVFNVDASAELTITANAFVYLQSIAIQSGDDWVAQTPTFEQSATYPSYEENKFKRLITDISFADSKITDDPVQQQFGPINGETVGNCT